MTEKVVNIWPLTGIWQTDSVVSESELEKDRPVLLEILATLPRAISTVSMTVTLHGRRWTFSQIGPRQVLIAGVV